MHAVREVGLPGGVLEQETNMCEECSPNFQEEIASAAAQAKSEPARMQIHEKARTMDYAAGIYMEADSYLKAPESRPASVDACLSSLRSRCSQREVLPRMRQAGDALKRKLACAQCGHAVREEESGTTRGKRRQERKAATAFVVPVELRSLPGLFVRVPDPRPRRGLLAAGQVIP